MNSTGREWSAAGRGADPAATPASSGSPWPVHALGVGTVERQAGEELRRHAAALARVVAPARRARPGGLRPSQLLEQLALPPDVREPAGVPHRSGAELVVDHERAGVHVADRVDQAHDAPGAAHVEAGERLAEGVEMEERVAREDVGPVGEEPAVDLALLLVRRAQLGPAVRAATGRPQSGDAQLRAVRIGESLELVELPNVVAGHHDRDLEWPEPGVPERVHRPACRRVRPTAPHGVVRGGVDPVEADLHVEVVHRRQPGRGRRIEERAVGGELDADAMVDRVRDEFEEVTADHRLASADVDVEHLQLAQLVEHRFGLGGGQLPRIPPARRRQAVNARQVAGVGQLPRQADGRVEPTLELINERGLAHGALRTTTATRARSRTTASGHGRRRTR